MHPATTLNLTGVAFSISNYRQMFDYVGIEPEFVRRSDYKSAVETFTATEPSAPTLEMMNELADELFDVLVSEIAEVRQRTPEDVDHWVDMGPWTATNAKENGLIDDIAYLDEVNEALETLIGDYPVEPLPGADTEDSPWLMSHKIATVHVVGAIVPGESTGGGLLNFGPTATGSRTVVRALKRAADDPAVKAIVLRVDSPGGSSYASEEIARAIDKVREDGIRSSLPWEVWPPREATTSPQVRTRSGRNLIPSLAPSASIRANSQRLLL